MNGRQLKQPPLKQTTSKKSRPIARGLNQDLAQSISGSRHLAPIISIEINSLIPHKTPPTPKRLLRKNKRTYEVLPFQDLVVIAQSKICYGQQAYSIADIAAIEIVQLYCRRSVIEKRTTNTLSGIAIAVGMALIVGAASEGFKLLGAVICVITLIQLALFYWKLLNQKVGEYGLAIRFQTGRQQIITSHTLAAIQALYAALYSRLNAYPSRITNCSNRFVSISMYTGILHSSQ